MFFPGSITSDKNYVQKRDDKQIVSYVTSKVTGYICGNCNKKYKASNLSFDNMYHAFDYHLCESNSQISFWYSFNVKETFFQVGDKVYVGVAVCY